MYTISTLWKLVWLVFLVKFCEKFNDTRKEDIFYFMDIMLIDFN